MELSSPRVKALTVSVGITFWFVIIISAFGMFSLELFAIFTITVFLGMQFIALKASKALNLFAIYSTNLFLGISYITIISLYGIFFRILKIDLLRLKKQEDSYWLEMEQLKSSNIFKQY